MMRCSVHVLPAEYRRHPLSHAIRACLKYWPSAAQTAGVAFALAGVRVDAATFTVTNTHDAGPGSLRQAVLDANTTPGADGIIFAPEVSGTIVLSSGRIDLTRSLRILGPGARRLTIDAEGADAVLNVFPEKTEPEIHVTVSGLTFTGAVVAIRAEDKDGPGGTTVLSIRDSVISGNGQGLSVKGSYFPTSYLPLHAVAASLHKVVVSHNRGAGIAVRWRDDYRASLIIGYAAASLTVTGSRIADNGGDGAANFGSPAGYGDNVWFTSAPVEVVDSVITANRGAGVSGHLAGATIRRSLISGNARGLSALGGDFTVEDSRIVGNSGAGASASNYCVGYRINDAGGNLSILNTTVTGNGGVGLAAEGSGYGAGLVLRNSTVAGNQGVGIAMDTGWSDGLSVQGSTVSGNAGGGIHFAAHRVQCDGYLAYARRVGLDVQNTTISANTGGCAVSVSSTVLKTDDYRGHDSERTITNSTVAGNSARGICHDAAELPLALQNTIVAGNGAGRVPDLSGPFTADWNLIGDPGTARLTETVAGSNLIGLDPLLGPLQNNGGATATHALLPGSPALERGDPLFTPPPEFDQRGPGFTRVFGGRLDIGAFEDQPLRPPRNLNPWVSFVPGPATYFRSADTTGCPAGAIGTFGFDARLTNTRQKALSGLAVEISKLTEGNLLLVDQAGLNAGDTFPVPWRDDYADGLLTPGEKLDVPFKLCLKTTQKFQFVTNVLGRLEAPAATRTQRRAARAADRLGTAALRAGVPR